jgi:uncharacterized protein
MFEDHLATINNKVDLLIFQGTQFCNINCSYCYLPNRNLKGRIAPDIVKLTANRLVAERLVGDKITVVWHAGEPLVVGVDYLGVLIDACSPLVEATPHLTHCVQTNATLIDGSFCTFFLERNIRVGVSLDGPKDIHDRHRRTRSGVGTFENVIKGIGCLQDHNVSFDIIGVLTASSLDYPEILYDFFADIKPRSVGFNIDEIEGQNIQSSMREHNYFEKLEQFWIRFIKHHFLKKAFHMREIDELLMGIRDGEFGKASKLTTPFSIVAVDITGNVATFSPELLGNHHPEFGDFTIGNVRAASFAKMAESERFHRMREQIDSGSKRCANECAYFAVCGGGAPSNKIAEHGTFAAAETLYCKATKKTVVDALIHVMREKSL